MCQQQGRICSRTDNKGAPPTLLHGRYALVGWTNEDTHSSGEVKRCFKTRPPRPPYHTIPAWPAGMATCAHATGTHLRSARHQRLGGPNADASLLHRHTRASRMPGALPGDGTLGAGLGWAGRGRAGEGRGSGGPAPRRAPPPPPPYIKGPSARARGSVVVATDGWQHPTLRTMQLVQVAQQQPSLTWGEFGSGSAKFHAPKFKFEKV